MLGEFDSPGAILRAAGMVRRAGYKHFDVHTPYPIHGMDAAMGLGRSKLGWIVAAGAAAGFLTAVILQVYTNWDYPLIHQAKPYQSWPAFVIVTFELSVLFAAFAAVFGMFALNGLPQWHHPTFNAGRFIDVGNNRFYVTIEARDEKYDLQKTRELLESAGAMTIEEITD
jgi:hypothetical protein